MEKTLHIKGMMCKHCAKRVSDALNALDGIDAVINLDAGTATLTGEEINVEAATKAVVDAGYEVTNVE